MKNTLQYLMLFCSIFLLAACGDPASLSEGEAADAVRKFLTVQPQFETGTFKFGEIKFSSKQDKAQLKHYQELEQDGYITMVLEKQKKKFLSRDSSFTYLVALTEKASGYVVQQQERKATVKALDYVVTNEKPVVFEKVGKDAAKITLTLNKTETPFSFVIDDKNKHSNFINKTYRLKYKKEIGWIVRD